MIKNTKKSWLLVGIIMFNFILFCIVRVDAQVFVKNDTLPLFNGIDIEGKPFDLSEYTTNQEPLLVLFLFTPQTGEEMASKLSVLDLQLGEKKIEIIGIGFKETTENLRQFVERLDIHYRVIPEQNLSEKSWISKVDVLPMVLFVVPPGMVIERILRGGGHKIDIIKETIELFYRKKDLDTANQLFNVVTPTEGFNSKDLQELKGYILSEQGKIEEAEKEFGSINSYAGLAKVAYQQGDYEKAIALADKAPDDGFAQTIKGMALRKLGKLQEAKVILENNLNKVPYDWMKAENLNIQGQIDQELGRDTEAIRQFEQAVALDPLNVVALSNKAIIHEKKGELDKAKEVLTEATKRRADTVSQTLLHQITEQIQKSNDTQRQKVIQEQIANLTEKFKELKAKGEVTQEVWDTRPPVLAFLQASSSGQGVIFDRAGVDIAFRHELERTIKNRLISLQIVERDMVDRLLQELQIGSSELATPDTQRRLGNILSARYLGFIEFARLGNSPMVYLRLVDTETTEVVGICSSPVDENDIVPSISKVCEEMEHCFKESYKNVRGTVVSVDTITKTATINLGKIHGIKEGIVFTLLQSGEPLEINGRRVGVKQIPVGKIEITEVENEFSIGNYTLSNQSVKIEKGMKVKGVLF